MSEESWHKMLIISLALHVLVVAFFSIPIKTSSKRIDLSSAYSVNLVGSAGNFGGSGTPKDLREPKQKPEKSLPEAKEKKASPKKPQPIKKEDDSVSISKKKVPPKNKATREEVNRLEERIKNIRKKDYIDVAKAGSGGSGRGGAGGGVGSGVPFSGDGTGKPLDPAMQKYLLDIWEKIKNAWNVPGMASYKKNLETIVMVKIRKDGRIVDISIEKRSGNRVYDESILRVLRAVEPLPPIPSSLNMDSIEVGFRFLPGEIS